MGLLLLVSFALVGLVTDFMCATLAILVIPPRDRETSGGRDSIPDCSFVKLGNHAG